MDDRQYHLLNVRVHICAQVYDTNFIFLLQLPLPAVPTRMVRWLLTRPGLRKRWVRFEHSSLWIQLSLARSQLICKPPFRHILSLAKDNTEGSSFQGICFLHQICSLYLGRGAKCVSMKFNLSYVSMLCLVAFATAFWKGKIVLLGTHQSVFKDKPDNIFSRSRVLKGWYKRLLFLAGCWSCDDKCFYIGGPATGRCVQLARRSNSVSSRRKGN